MKGIKQKEAPLAGKTNKLDKSIKADMSDITRIWVDLLEPFSRDYLLKISASDLARKCHVPQQTASRYLNKLAKLNIINYVKEGRNKLFYLDLEKETTKIVLNFIELRKAQKFQMTLKATSVIINQILKHCESLIVFGSYASGNFDEESDLDIVVLGKCDKRGIKKIKAGLAVSVNEYYASYREFAKLLGMRNPLAIEIMRNHVLFGDVSKVVDIFWRREYERR